MTQEQAFLIASALPRGVVTQGKSKGRFVVIADAHTREQNDLRFIKNLVASICGDDRECMVEFFEDEERLSKVRIALG